MPVGIWKSVPHHELLGKYKLKPKCEITINQHLQNWQGWGTTRLSCTSCGHVTGLISLENCSVFSLKMNYNCSEPAILVLDIYARKVQPHRHQVTRTGMLIATLFIIVPNWKQPTRQESGWILEYRLEYYTVIIAVHNDLDEFHRHNTEQKTSDKERNIWFHL